MVPNFLPYSMSNFTIEKYWHRVVSTVDWFGSAFITGAVAGFAQKWALRSIIPFPFFSFYDYNRRSSFSFTDMPDPLYPVGARTNDVSFKLFKNFEKKLIFINFSTSRLEPTAQLRKRCWMRIGNSLSVTRNRKVIFKTYVLTEYIQAADKKYCRTTVT